MQGDKYNKLVRDKIPEIIRKDNQYPVIRRASEEEYRQKLLEKFGEEVNEFYREECTGELIDIVEVIYAIAKSKGIGKKQFDKIREQKRNERDGFEKRIILEEIRIKPDVL